VVDLGIVVEARYDLVLDAKKGKGKTGGNPSPNNLVEKGKGEGESATSPRKLQREREGINLGY
jgi:hypothetical protein